MLHTHTYIIVIYIIVICNIILYYYNIHEYSGLGTALAFGPRLLPGEGPTVVLRWRRLAPQRNGDSTWDHMTWGSHVWRKKPIKT